MLLHRHISLIPAAVVGIVWPFVKPHKGKLVMEAYPLRVILFHIVVNPRLFVGGLYYTECT